MIEAFSQLDWLQLLVYATGGLVASVALIAGLALALHVEPRYRRFYVPLVLALVLLMPVISVALSNRDLTAVVFLSGGITSSSSAAWVLRIASVLVVGLSIVRLIGHGFEKKKVRGGGYLLAAFLFMYVCVQVLSALMGTVPVRPLEAAAYVALMFSAVFCSRGEGSRLSMNTAKIALLLILVGGFVMMFISPQLVQERGMMSERLPGIDFRYAGLASNPNAMAPMALVSLLMVIDKPFRSKALTMVNVLLALLTILLAQSQTTWLATIVSSIILLSHKLGIRFGDRRVLVTVCLISVAGLSMMAVKAILQSTGAGVSDLLSPERYQQITSLTGRDSIWLAALSEWRDSPLFGYGPTMWSAEYRARIGMGFAFSAHNQFIQALAISGLVGLLGTLCYLAAMLMATAKAPDRKRGFLIAMMATLLLRCFTETPLEVGSIFVNELGLHLIQFVALASVYGRSGGASGVGRRHRQSEEEPRAKAGARRRRRSSSRPSSRPAQPVGEPARLRETVS